MITKCILEEIDYDIKGVDWCFLFLCFIGDIVLFPVYILLYIPFVLFIRHLIKKNRGNNEN